MPAHHPSLSALRRRSASPVTLWLGLGLFLLTSIGDDYGTVLSGSLGLMAAVLGLGVGLRHWQSSWAAVRVRHRLTFSDTGIVIVSDF